MNEKYNFIQRSCNSTSTLSGFIQRNQSKVIFSLLTNVKAVELFEKTLIGGFSSVKTRLVFDTNILMPDTKNNNETIKRKDIKIGYKIIDEKTTKYKNKRIVSKIL